MACIQHFPSRAYPHHIFTLNQGIMAEKILDQLNSSSMFDLTGVVAVVTGGGTGIGLMMSTTLVSNGATVYIIGPIQVDLDK